MKDTHAEDCYKNGGKKDCPLKGNRSNPKFYASCYQEKEAKTLDIHEVASDMIEQESSILEKEMRDFLAKHNLPMNREKIKETGFEVVTEQIMPSDMLGDTKYIFKLCRVVDQHKIKITRDFNVTENSARFTNTIKKDNE